MKKNEMETATFAGGCFWCTEAIFRRLKGVVSITSGYTGGSAENPIYENVLSGVSGHAEAIEIKFDPKIISFDKLLEVFWATHDPTTFDKQGFDIGSQYRSAIFYHNEEQKKKTEESKKKIEKTGRFRNRVVTKIEPSAVFHKAEEYHQSYYEKNKDSNPYCRVVIDPKIQKLLEKFNNDIKDEFKLEHDNFRYHLRQSSAM